MKKDFFAKLMSKKEHLTEGLTHILKIKNNMNLENDKPRVKYL